jgi:hypothetical protein
LSWLIRLSQSLPLKAADAVDRMKVVLTEKKLVVGLMMRHRRVKH